MVPAGETTEGAQREEVLRIAEIVLTVLEARKTTTKSASWQTLIGTFLVERWAFVLSLFAVASLLVASFLYGASPLYYFKQIAISDHELDEKMAKAEFEKRLTTMYVELGNNLLDEGFSKEADDAFAEAQKI